MKLEPGTLVSLWDSRLHDVVIVCPVNEDGSLNNFSGARYPQGILAMPLTEVVVSGFRAWVVLIEGSTGWIHEDFMKPVGYTPGKRSRRNLAR